MIKGVMPTSLHMGSQQLENQQFENNQFGKRLNMYNMQSVFDIRLKENFKLFVLGPSRCGKTVFVSKLPENIHIFDKLPTRTVIYL